MPRIAPPHSAQLSDDARQMLAEVRREIGSEPILMRLLSHAPPALRGFLEMRASLKRSSLPSTLRERIAIAVAATNACHCCASNHRHFGQCAGIAETELAAAMCSTSADPATAQALQFAHALIEARGHVDDGALARVRSAGFNERAIIEIVAVVATNIFANLVNNLAQSVPDHFAPD